MLHVLLQDGALDLLERRAYRAGLGQDIDAVPLVLEHPDETLHLSLNAAEADQLSLVFGVFHDRYYTLVWYNLSSRPPNTTGFQIRDS